MTVTTWPSYLLNRIPLPLRERMSAEAEENQMSVADVVRSALCEYYGLECDLRSSTYFPRGLSSSMVLRLQPEIFQALADQSARSGHSIRRIVLDVLHAHYGMTP